MLPLRYPKEWRIANIVLLVLVLIAALMPLAWMWPDSRAFTSWFGTVDKWIHGLTFMMLAVWFAGQYDRPAYWRIALGLAAFGVLIEACQGAMGYRTPDAFDVAADVGGIVAGLLFASVGVGGWALRLEALLDGGARRE
jgi:VanZ family protein